MQPPPMMTCVSTTEWRLPRSIEAATDAEHDEDRGEAAEHDQENAPGAEIADATFDDVTGVMSA